MVGTEVNPESGALGVRVGRTLFRHRPWVAVGLLPALGFWLEVEQETLIWSLGVALILAGAALRLWSISHLGRSARTRKDKARKLVTTGPFSMCRNPIYLANMIVAAGVVVLCETLWYLPVCLGFFFCFYSLAVSYEENLLLHRFSAQYAAYAQRTPRWIPCVTLKSCGKSSYGLREVLYRERSFFLLLVAAFSVVGIKELVSDLLA